MIQKVKIFKTNFSHFIAIIFANLRKEARRKILLYFCEDKKGTRFLFSLSEPSFCLYNHNYNYLNNNDQDIFVRFLA